MDSMLPIFLGLGSLIGGISRINQAKERERESAENANKATTAYSKINSYNFNDLYNPLIKGLSGKNIKDYEKGEALSAGIVNDYLYKDLSNELLDKSNSLGKGLRDLRLYIQQVAKDGLTQSDYAKLEKILNGQRQQTKLLNNTIVQKSIERGVNPYRAKLMQFLTESQGFAESANRAAVDLAMKAGDRKMAGIRMLSDDLADEYSRKLELAKARDHISFYNVEQKNKQGLKNWERGNQVRDINAKIHNEIAKYNNENFISAKKNVTDSKNKKQLTLGDFFSQRASELGNDASRKDNSGYSQLMSSLKSFSSLF